MSVALHRTTGTSGIRKLRVHDAAHAIQLVKGGYVRTAAGLKRFYSSFSASVSRTFVFAGGYGATTITSSPVTATATGGYGTLTYSWTYVSGDAITILSPNSASTSFRKNVNPGDIFSAVFHCTITDGSGQSVTTPNVTVNIVNNSSSA